MRDKGSGAIAIPKASWGCAPSLAESYVSGFPKTSRRQLKSFLIQQFFKNAGEGQGE